ncbi:MAG TPA: hypothetical protein VI072_16025, partial [Polyangiaceae bacterium]
YQFRSVGPAELRPEDSAKLSALLAVLPPTGCLPYPLNVNCDHFYPTNFNANGTRYVQHNCALEPCWTADMTAVLELIDELAAREL